MVCPACGANVANDSLRTCPYCGVPLNGAPREANPQERAPREEPPAARVAYTPAAHRPPAYAPVYGTKPVKGKMIASMVLGIVSAVTAWFGWGAIAGIATGIVALVLGVKAKKQAPYGTSVGMATAGIVCGAVGLGLSAVMFTLTILRTVAVASAMSELYGLFGELY